MIKEWVIRSAELFGMKKIFLMLIYNSDLRDIDIFIFYPMNAFKYNYSRYNMDNVIP